MQKTFSYLINHFKKSMLQSKCNSQKDTPSPQTVQSSLIFSPEAQNKEMAKFPLDQRNLAVENPQKKWEHSEFRDWLCFVVQHSINSPYIDVEDELLSSRSGDKIFEGLQKSIKTKNRIQCFKFTRKLLRELNTRGNEGLVSWCIKKLKNMSQDGKVGELLSKYEAFANQKSEYMKILGKMNQFYEMEEIQSLRIQG